MLVSAIAALMLNLRNEQLMKQKHGERAYNANLEWSLKRRIKFVTAAP